MEFPPSFSAASLLGLFNVFHAGLCLQQNPAGLLPAGFSFTDTEHVLYDKDFPCLDNRSVN